MQYNLPNSIRNSNDLNAFQEYLDADQTVTENTEEPQSKNFEMQIEKDNGNMSYNPTKNRYVPEPLSNTAFMPAYLSKHIGKLVKVEFLLNNQLEKRIGILMTVGANYIVLRQYQNNSTLVCDIFSIKFVTIVPDNDLKKLMMN